MKSDTEFRINLECDSDTTPKDGDTISKKCFCCKNYFFVKVGGKYEHDNCCKGCWGLNFSNNQNW